MGGYFIIQWILFVLQMVFLAVRIAFSIAIQIIISLFQLSLKPVMLDFILVVGGLGYYIYSNKGYEWWIAGLVAFVVASISTFIMVKIKYIGKIMLVIYGTVGGFALYYYSRIGMNISCNWFGIENYFKSTLVIAVILGIAYFVEHIIFGIVQTNNIANDIVGEPINIFKYIKKLYCKITKKEYDDDDDFNIDDYMLTDEEAEIVRQRMVQQENL